jgi:nucleoside-diphosphate-sugar epimerase
VQRFVFTSSVSVYGEVDSSTGVGEDHPHVPNSPYSESKIQSEKLVWQAYRERGLPVSILRPCVVYGPRDHHFSNLLLRNLNGRLPLIRNGAALLDLVHVHDVAEAHLLAGTSDSAVGQAYNVTDGERHTIRELVDLVGRLAHLPPHLMRVPYPLALGGAAVAAAFSALRGKRPLITPGTVRAMTRDHHYRIEKARAELGFVPKIKLEEGWRETVEWFKTHMK